MHGDAPSTGRINTHILTHNLSKMHVPTLCIKDADVVCSFVLFQPTGVVSCQECTSLQSIRMDKAALVASECAPTRLRPNVVMCCAMLCCAAQSLPLLGGRNASAHAAAVIELLCSPPAAAAAPAAAGSSSSAGKDGGKSGKASRAASAKSTSGSSAAAGGEAALASALQQGIVAAGGLQALLKVCNIDAAVSTDGMNLNAAALRSHRQKGMHENGGKHAPLTEAPQPRRVRHT